MDDNPLSKSEIHLFKHLNQHKKNFNTKLKLLNFIRSILPLIGKKEDEAKLYYEIYVSNYRPNGDYEKLTKESFKDYKFFKQRKTPNHSAYEYTNAKIPFKGSNLEGLWEINNNNEFVYVVLSYGWYPIFLFTDNKWFEVSNTYSSSTSKHIRQSYPGRYSSDLNSQIYSVTKNEMEDLRYGYRKYEQILKDRINNFLEERVPNVTGLINKDKYISFGWRDEKRKVNYRIKNIFKSNDKIKIEVVINKAGKVEGVNRLVIDPKGYEVPSQFSNEIENGVKHKIINDNADFLSLDNTIFEFDHRQSSDKIS